MKKLLIAAVSCSMILCGCGDEASSSSTSEPLSLMRVGQEKYGFIDVPDDWIRVDDSLMEGNKVIQFSAADDSSVITMQYLKDTDALTSTMNLGTMLEDTLENLDSTVCEFNGSEQAYQLYGLDSESGRIMACWLFDDKKGITHVLSIESNDDRILELSDTYLLTE